ncbi:MAG TPA: helix-turn-helix transcriptional regulator [Blastocatellia bacterium]|nr:helix-turn-helix transcriptional regulator [Blastocatellia bacterium]
MIKWTVSEVARRAGIKNARDLARLARVHLNTAYGIWNGTAKRVDLATIDRICTVLQVKPGQLFEHDAEPDAVARRPLKGLR